MFPFSLHPSLASSFYLSWYGLAGFSASKKRWREERQAATLITIQLRSLNNRAEFTKIEFSTTAKGLPA